MEYSRQESILFTYSTTSVITGKDCVPPMLRLVKFNGPFDQPFVRYLKTDLFNQTQFCKSCKEPTEAHSTSYIHGQRKLTFNVRRIPSLKLEGKEEGKIWTWRRCLICDLIDGIPQATRRTVMSDDDEGLSFGKLLVMAYYETRNSLAPCGHSLQRDCLQYYGFGDMVIFLQHSSSIKKFYVCFPSSILDFNASVAPLLSNAAAVYDNESTRAISYALNSKDYKDQIEDKKPLLSESDKSVSDYEPDCQCLDSKISHSSTSNQKPSHHVTTSFEDDSPTVMGKMKKKFSATCYFAREFDALRKIYRVGELDFVQSLSHCSAMGRKTDNAFFPKSSDERLIIKQVSKTELETFVEFASKYFRYLIGSLRTEMPSCLTRILGVYKVTTTHLNQEDDNKEKCTMELMVIENIFFKRKISRIYSLKKSIRYHDISKITDPDEVLLDMNGSEEVHSMSFFIPVNRLRTLQRAIWNDTSFLRGFEVTDYFLLIGVDEECQELVIGIFEFFPQYTSDEHTETWMLVSKYYSDCISGSGQENADSPTIVSPHEFRRRFRKLVSTSFVGLFE